MKNKIFDISFDSGGKHYKGWVNPSDKIDDNGKPASWHVVLNEVSFGHLSLQNCKWTISEERPAALVEAAGKQIEQYYKL